MSDPSTTGIDHYRDIQEDDRFELNGTEWHVERIHDGFGSDCDYTRIIEACDPGGVFNLFVVFPTEVRRATTIVFMNRGEYEVVAEPPQQTLSVATDGDDENRSAHTDMDRSRGER